MPSSRSKESGERNAKESGSGFEGRRGCTKARCTRESNWEATTRLPHFPPTSPSYARPRQGWTILRTIHSETSLLKLSSPVGLFATLFPLGENSHLSFEATVHVGREEHSPAANDGSFERPLTLRSSVRRSRECLISLEISTCILGRRKGCSWSNVRWRI